MNCNIFSINVLYILTTIRSEFSQFTLQEIPVLVILEWCSGNALAGSPSLFRCRLVWEMCFGSYRPVTMPCGVVFWIVDTNSQLWATNRQLLTIRTPVLRLVKFLKTEDVREGHPSNTTSNQGDVTTSARSF